MAKDFSAKQIRVTQILASGGFSTTNVGLAIYSASNASNLVGGVPATLVSGVGSDVFLFVSGTKAGRQKAHGGVTLFGGDVVISGTMYAERSVIEVNTTTTGSLMISGSLAVSQSATINEGLTVNNSGESGPENDFTLKGSGNTTLLFGDVSTNKIGIGVTDPDSTLEIFSTSTQLKLSNNAADFATLAVGTNGDLTVTTVDAAAGAADFTVVADGAVDIDANQGALSLDGSAGINIGTETDVAIDIDSTTLDIDASGGVTIDTSGGNAISLDADAASNFTTSGGALTLEGKTGVLIKENGTGIISVDDDRDVDIQNAREIDIDSSGPITIDSATSISIGTNADKPIDIDATTLDIDASGALTIDSATSISIGTNADKPIDIDATTLDIDATGDITINSGDQVLILSGGAASSPNESAAADMVFFVSGAIASKNTGNKGTSVFGGDVIVSGALHGGLSGNAASMTPLMIGHYRKDLGTDVTTLFVGNVGGSGTALFDGNIFSSGSITLMNTLSASLVKGEYLTGSLTRLLDGRAYLRRGANVTITTGSLGQVTISSTDTNTEYTAGDGLDLTGTTFKTDLKAAGGLLIDSAKLAIDNSVVATISGSSFRGVVGFQDDIGVTGSLGVAADIVHIGDPNTKISFGTDEVQVTAGGVGYLKAKASETTFSINPDAQAISTVIQGTGKIGIGVEATTNRVLVLSGGAAASIDESSGNDVSFYVSGSIDTRGTNTRGTSVFGGDLVITGSTRSEFGLSGSLTRLVDETSYLKAGANVTITSASNGQVVVAAVNTDTTYTAGDGLDLSGTTFSTDLKSSGGLKIAAAKLAVEPGDFAGTGLEDDGSDNLRIAASAAGTGLSGGGGSALSIDNSVVATISGSQFRGTVGVTGSLGTTGDLNVAEYIKHSGDDDTFIRIDPDRMRFYVGNIQSLTMKEDGAGSTFSINPDNNTNMDFKVKTVDRTALRIDSGLNQVLVLSGGAAHSPDEAAGTDLAFFVSGAIGSKATTVKGTAIFGGDTVVSGALFLEELSPPNSVGDGTVALYGKDDSGVTKLYFKNESGETEIGSGGGGTPGGSDTQIQYNNGGAFGGAADLTFNDGTGDITVGASTSDAKLFFRDTGIHINSPADGKLNLASDGRVMIMSGGAQQEPVDESTGVDVSFYVSGSKGPAVVGGSGLALFGGDVVVSGSSRIRRGFEVNADIGAGDFIHFGSSTGKEMISSLSSLGQVLILSGGAPGSANEINGLDLAFFVSGSKNSKGTNTKGTAVFGGDLAVSGNIHTAEFIYHDGDNDTFIQFAGDSIGITAGGEQLITISESGQDVVQIGDGGDVDFQVRTDGNDNTLFVEGSSDKVGIGTNAPGTLLQLEGADAYITLKNTTNEHTDGGAETRIIFEDHSDTALAQIQASHDGAVNNTKGDLIFSTHNGTDLTEAMRIDSSGRVGIGTDNPDTALYISDSAPTVTIKRESNANDSTIKFLGQAGATATMVHMATSNDLVFSTHDGSDQEEILRLGSFNVSDKRRIVMLSGSNVAPGSMQPSDTSDINFFVSGTIGSRGSGVKGTSVFGGDLVVSGALALNQGAAAGSQVFVTTGGRLGIGTASPSYKLEVGGSMAIGEYIYHRNDSNTFIRFEPDTITAQAGGKQMIKMIEDAENSQMLIMSGGAAGDPDESLGVDMSFFVSGAIGSRNTGVRGTAVFGGDVVISGTLGGGSPLSIGSNLELDAPDPTITFRESGLEKATIGVNSSDNILFENKSANKHIVFKINDADDAGSKEALRIDGAVSEVVVNQGDKSLVDFRVETNNKPHAIFTDGSTDQVLILSGGAASSVDEAKGVDVNFYVSGSKDSRSTTTSGTSLFGGDVVVSGTMDLQGGYRVQTRSAIRGDTVAMNNEDEVVICFTNTGGSGGVTVNLPAINNIGSGKVVRIIDGQNAAGTNNITVNVGDASNDRIYAGGLLGQSFVINNNSDSVELVSFIDPALTPDNGWFQIS